MWGCSFRCLCQRCTTSVFPTHVGMFPSSCHGRSNQHSLPHACGGVPYGAPARVGGNFVFLTHVGVSLFTLAIGVSSPRMWGFPKKAKIFLFCLPLESACYISAFNEPTLVGSLLNRLCLCRPSSSLLDRVWELWVARHISARFVNLTFHLRRNHHVRRICS